MLQRFRNNRDFNAVDKYKPKYKTPEEADEVRSKENTWWRANAVTEEQKEVEQKNKVEKGRYIAAMKALIREKGQQFGNGEIPPITNWDKPGFEEIAASNCQFYKNEKGYVRALRDILHSMQQFK